MMTPTHSDDQAGTGGPDPTIVVGYDGSDTAHAAFAYACRRAGAHGRVFVVQAYELPPDLLGFPNYDRLLEERQRHGRGLLDVIRTECEGEAWIETELIGGPPAQAIADRPVVVIPAAAGGDAHAS